MHKIDASTMDRYRKILAQDPSSQVFAPLAEAHRERGQLDEALRVARHGIHRHPKFSGGLVVLGKILKDQKKLAEATKVLEQVITLDSMNLLAYQILGDICLELQKPKEALKYYKMVLFMNPQSTKAQRVVQKLESLSADEYDPDIFEMTPLNSMRANNHLSMAPPPKAPVAAEMTMEKPVPKGLNRMLSLVDAFIVRNDLAKAQYLLSETEMEFGDHAEIQQRRKVLYNRQASQLGHEDGEVERIAPISSRENAIRKRKLDLLQAALRVIERGQP